MIEHFGPLVKNFRFEAKHKSYRAFIEGIEFGKKEFLKRKNLNHVNIICDAAGHYRRKNCFIAWAFMS